jgi:catechol 2,3-dioxygenase
MIDWYRKVLGMTINHRSAALGGPRNGPWHSATFVSNNEVKHRIVFFEMPGLVLDPDKRRHARLQHVAFEYETLDDLLGTYARLKCLGILPVLAADQGLQTSVYYLDPDQKSVELNVNNYGNEGTATEHIKNSSSKLAYVDPDKMLVGAQRGRVPLGIARACRRRRVRSDKAVRWAQPPLNRVTQLEQAKSSDRFFCFVLFFFVR